MLWQILRWPITVAFRMITSAWLLRTQGPNYIACAHIVALLAADVSLFISQRYAELHPELIKGEELPTQPPTLDLDADVNNQG